MTPLSSECTKLAILDLNQNDARVAAQDLVKAFEAQGKPKGSIQAIGLGVDVSKEDSVNAGFQQVHDTFGKLDVGRILVYNRSIHLENRLADYICSPRLIYQCVVNSAGFCENFTAEDCKSLKVILLDCKLLTLVFNVWSRHRSYTQPEKGESSDARLMNRQTHALGDSLTMSLTNPSSGKQLADVNILGSFYIAREAAKFMHPGSSIVMIGSMSGTVINVPQPQTPYNFSSKFYQILFPHTLIQTGHHRLTTTTLVLCNKTEAAVIHMVKSLAVEWAPKGIRVNCISPGYVLTNLTKVILDKNTELRDQWVNRVPMGRLVSRRISFFYF